MTIEVTNPIAGPYTPNGVTTDFPFSFKIMSTNEIRVVDASENVIDLGYSVTIAASGEGGTVSFANPVPSDIGEFYIQADPAFGQPTLYGATTTFNPGSLNNPTDRLAAQNIILKNLSDRGIRYPIGETTQIMPSAADRAGKFFAHDADGELIMSSGTGADIGLRTDLAADTGTTLIKAADGKTLQENLDHGGWFIQSGDGAVERKTQDKARETVSVTDYGAVPSETSDGAVDCSAAFQLAIDSGAAEIFIPEGYYLLGTTITIGIGQSLVSAPAKRTTLTYTGDGIAISYVSSSGSGTRFYSSGARNFLLTTTTGAIGFDVDTLSEGVFEHLTVAGFSDNGFNLHTSHSGGSVYTRFYNVKAQSCGTGFRLAEDGDGSSSYTNDTIFIACRANICTTGWSLGGGNHNIILASQVEACDVGVDVSTPGTASGNANLIGNTRFESNTTCVHIGTGVIGTVLDNNTYVDGVVLIDDDPVNNRTQQLGSYRAQHRQISALQNADGSYYFARTANGGSQTPCFVVDETNSVNSPVAIESRVKASSRDARFYRAKFSGTSKWGVDIFGRIVDLPTSNGPTGTFTLGAAATTTINNSAINAASMIFLQPTNAAAATLTGSSKCLYISARTASTSFAVSTADGTAAAGTETFAYWLVN